MLHTQSQIPLVAFFIGPSLAYGSKFYQYDPIDDENEYIGFTKLGLYANFDYTYKISYDLGVGVSIYNSYNSEYHIYGFQIHVYFSGAFRKEI